MRATQAELQAVMVATFRDTALDNFAAQDQAKVELVKLRYFVGFSEEEAAEVLRISAPTAKRWWRAPRPGCRRIASQHH